VRPENVRFFASAAGLRAWLDANEDSAASQWIGFYKKGSARTGVSYAEAVDEALCHGWIDGQLGGIDDESYAIRFTPRRPRSVWSTTNVTRMGELVEQGRVTRRGLRAFEARTPERTGVYAHDMAEAGFPADLEALLRANETAWRFWHSQPPGYRRQMTWWVVSAKRDETRQRRMAALIEEHAAGRRLDPLKLPRLAAGQAKR